LLDRAYPKKNLDLRHEVAFVIDSRKYFVIAASFEITPIYLTVCFFIYRHSFFRLTNFLKKN